MRIIPRYFADKACMWLLSALHKMETAEGGKKARSLNVVNLRHCPMRGASECDGEFQLVGYPLFAI